MDKKQIVFIEPKATINAYRIARSLRLTKRYETILICFSKIDRDFYSKAYNKILILELSHKIDKDFPKTVVHFFKKIFGKDGRSLIKEIKEMKPYIFQITGPDLFILLILFLLKKNIPKVYYANDLWGVEKRSFLFKKYGLKGEFQRFCERICFRKVNGILNKHAPEQFELLDFEINIPKIALFSYCLDEWTFPPKKKKSREIHIGYGGSPFPSWGENVSFLEIVKIITSQKIHLHSYGPCTNKNDDPILIQESKKNKYYHFHNKVSPYNLNKEMSAYHFGIFPEFWNSKQVNSNPGIVKTEIPTKMMNYIEAGIPIISSEQNEGMIDTIEKFGIGFKINLEDLKRLRQIIEKIDYEKLQKNIKSFQEKFRWSKGVKDIEQFYEKIIKIKT